MMLGFGVYQSVCSTKLSLIIVDRVGGAWAASNCINAIWVSVENFPTGLRALLLLKLARLLTHPPLRSQVLLWHLGFRLLAVPFGFLLLACVAAAMWLGGGWQRAEQPHRTIIDVLAVDLGLSFYAGWLTVCLLVNMGELGDIPPHVVAIAVAATGAVAMLVLVLRFDPAFPLAFIWCCWTLQSGDRLGPGYVARVGQAGMYVVGLADLAMALVVTARLFKLGMLRWQRNKLAAKGGGLLRLASPV